jgi:hypothetical protein
MTTSTNLTIVGLFLDIIGFYFLFREVKVSQTIDEAEIEIEKIQRELSKNNDGMPSFLLKHMFHETITDPLSDSEAKSVWKNSSEDTKNDILSLEKLTSQLLQAKFNHFNKIKQAHAMPRRKLFLNIGGGLILSGFLFLIAGVYAGLR